MSDNNDFTQDLEQLLDEHDYSTPEVGEVRDSVIVSISQQGIIVDLGLKRDGIVPTSDLEKLSEEKRASLQVNDEVPVYIVSTSDPEGLIVSIHRAVVQEDWVRAQELMDSGEIFEVVIAGYNRGGLIAPFGGLRGFIPASHHSELNPGMNDRQRQRRMAKLNGVKYPVRIIEVDPRRRRLVMSQREAQKEWEQARKAELLEKLHEGDIVPGRVTSLSDFGAFVDIGGADGLIHVSELAWHRVDHPREVVQVGDEFDVQILRLDREGQRISLSRKKLLANPWDSVEERYKVGQLVEGTITRIVDYGAFVEIEPGIEGLLHSSRLARNAEVANPREIVKEREKHLLRIVNMNPKRQRIALSLKAVTAQEQIDWMARQSLAAEAETEGEAPPAVEAAAEAETTAEIVTETGVAEMAETAAVEAAETAAAEATEAEMAETAAVEATEAEAAETATAEATETDMAETAAVEATEAEMAETAAAEATEAEAETAAVEATEAEAETAAAEAAETAAAEAATETTSTEAADAAADDEEE